MDKGKFYSGLAIMLGLIVLGLMIPKAVREFRSFDRTVNVKGLCEREVEADKVIWPVVYKVMDNDLGNIYSVTDRNNAAIVEFLKSGGLQDSEITVSVPSISDKYANEYGNNDRTYRYIATNIVTVCTDKVDDVLALMSRQSELLRKGIVTAGNDWENPVEFRYESLNDIKPEMIEEATKNAREAAQKFATDSGSSLGKIKTASQGTFTISDRDSNTPYIKKVRVVSSVTYYLKNYALRGLSARRTGPSDYYRLHIGAGFFFRLVERLEEGVARAFPAYGGRVAVPGVYRRIRVEDYELLHYGAYLVVVFAVGEVGASDRPGEERVSAEKHVPSVVVQ